ncbi:hypothetical protein AKJ09_09730 [Labilithrix luteola]|uniref:Uncharacterized protein n=1 Tax=Labilithrix luteola TaxID=1391654 RepID=A0A0K1QBM2_9BACT|nr:hypothetical protein AKJ09_09730 [Labilithrix luteola]
MIRALGATRAGECAADQANQDPQEARRQKTSRVAAPCWFTRLRPPRAFNAARPSPSPLGAPRTLSS